jgi:hypothetical protein
VMVKSGGLMCVLVVGVMTCGGGCCLGEVVGG